VAVKCAGLLLLLLLLLLLQVFQAYEQRLPARAVIEMTRRSAIAPGGKGGSLAAMCSNQHASGSSQEHHVCITCMIHALRSNCKTYYLDAPVPRCRPKQKPGIPSMQFVLYAHAAGAYPYDCPADALLDVSWHRTPNDTRSEVTQWLMRPDLAGVVSVSACVSVLTVDGHPNKPVKSYLMQRRHAGTPAARLGRRGIHNGATKCTAYCICSNYTSTGCSCTN
jgi:hypothetical protein